MFFSGNLFVSTCLLHMYACYTCTNGFPCGIVLDMFCLCYVWNTTLMCYICNKGVMDVTSLSSYICNSHSFLQMFAQHCYLCYKRQHPECQRKELWQEVSKFVCDMTTCYIPDWHSYLHISWSNCLLRMQKKPMFGMPARNNCDKNVSNSRYICGVVTYITDSLRM